MSVKKRGNVWQVDVRLEGHGRLRPSFPSEEEAVNWEADARHAAKMGRPLPSAETAIIKGGGRVATLQDLFIDLKADWEMRGISDLLNQTARTREFLDWFGGNRHPRDVTEIEIDKYCTHLWNNLGNSGATINRKVSMVRSLLKLAVRYRLIDRLPETKRFNETKGSLNFLNFGEEDPVIAALEHWGYSALADLVRFLVDTGCRIREAINLEWRTVREGRVTFENRKNGQYGTVPLTKRGREVLERRRTQGKHPDRPFGEININSDREIMRRVYKKLGGPYASITQPFHVYRHSCASRLAIRGVDAKRIMEWMDHSSLQVTQRYMKLSVVSLDDAVSALEAEPAKTIFSPKGVSKPVTKPVSKRTQDVTTKPRKVREVA